MLDYFRRFPPLHTVFGNEQSHYSPLSSEWKLITVLLLSLHYLPCDVQHFGMHAPTNELDNNALYSITVLPHKYDKILASNLNRFCNDSPSACSASTRTVTKLRLLISQRDSPLSDTLPIGSIEKMTIGKRKFRS